MNTAQLLNDIEQLPLEAQLQIEEFIAVIKTSYQLLDNKPQATIIKGDKTIDPSELFGMWENQPRDLKTIRKQAWQRSEIEK